MNLFELNKTFSADCLVAENTRMGELYHVSRNSHGGSILTLIARFFVWRPEFTEGFNKYWRVDCFVHQHKMSPDPLELGELLVESLLRERLCDEPILMSAHLSNEIAYKTYGEVVADD